MPYLVTVLGLAYMLSAVGNPAIAEPGEIGISMPGIAGALVAYALLFRTQRLNAVLRSAKTSWAVLLFDLLVFIGPGGLVAFYMATTVKEAFTFGMSWQAIAGGIIAGNERKILQGAKARGKAKAKKPPAGSRKNTPSSPPEETGDEPAEGGDG